MVYKEVPIEKIKDNPFQTRKEYKPDMLAGLATSASDNLGIRNAPLLRPNPNGDGTYQTASGHLRVRTARTLLGLKTVMARVEDLTDAQMKKEVLVENVHRSNLNEKERFEALEQYRKELGLKKEDYGFLSAMEKATGISHERLREIYAIVDVRNKLKVGCPANFKQPTTAVILESLGLPEKERLKLIIKASEEGLGARAVRLIHTAIKQLTPEVQNLVLDKDAQLSRKTIEAITTIKDVEAQKETIKIIKTHGYNEDLALRFIDRAKQGNLTLNVLVQNEPERVMAKIRFGYENIASWGVNEKQILGARWGEALKIFNEIEKKITELKRL